MGRKKYVALHEAAHAVVAEKLGCRVDVVKLTRNDRGLCRYRTPKRPDPLVLAMIAMAGHAADVEWSGLRVGLVPVDDHRFVRRLGFSGRSLPTILELARGQVNEHSIAIQHIADVLMQRDLKGAELRRLVVGNETSRAR